MRPQQWGTTSSAKEGQTSIGQKWNRLKPMYFQPEWDRETQSFKKEIRRIKWEDIVLNWGDANFKPTVDSEKLEIHKRTDTGTDHHRFLRKFSKSTATTKRPKEFRNSDNQQMFDHFTKEKDVVAKSKTD